jgi:hypothetical protein
MADQELAEILSEYQNLAESEHQSFVSGLLHSATFAATVFSALQIYEVRGVQCCGTRNDLVRPSGSDFGKISFPVPAPFLVSESRPTQFFNNQKNVHKKILPFQC